MKALPLLSAALLALAPLDAQTRSRARPVVGINLAGPADWNTEMPFEDMFRFSRPWVSQRPGAAWGKGPALELDERGWVRRLEEGCFAESPVCTVHGGHYPVGRYTLRFDGKGRLDLSNGGAVQRKGRGHLSVEVGSAARSMMLRLRETDPEDPVRNIRLLIPGADGRAKTSPFRADFLERWAGFASIRFMDWMETNNSEIRAWADRPTLEDATWSKQGVPVEVMVDLANRLQAEPWFCMPHQADDDYVRRFAQAVKAGLDRRLRVHVEYSNELWNGLFAQARYAQAQGLEAGLADKAWVAGWRYTAQRSVEIFDIWEDVFGGTKRLVRVLATQAVNPFVSEQILTHEDAYRSADVLAVAPYISLNAGPRSDPSAADVAGWDLDRLFAHVDARSLPKATTAMRKQKEVADRYGLGLVAYEAGQHLVGIGSGQNNAQVEALFKAANADPRMEQVYDRYHAAWSEAGGGLMCHFSSVTAWSKYGSWGLLQYADDDPAASPKLRAVRSWARAQGQKVAKRRRR
ncbi:MAG: hypothetical protein ACON4Z_01540 [Planctomycetota bacterium]